MGKLSQWFKNLIEKWKALSKNKKIAFGIIFAAVIASLIYISVSLGSTKYEVLFSNMNSTDSAAVYKQLQTDKVDAKVQGQSILVPKGQVDEVRMKILSEVSLTNGSQGFEILDKSQFGSTDAQTKINYQRALQGELERTIKSFPEVQNARVHLVLPDDTAFVKDTQPGSASVTLQLKAGQKLSQDQVRALVSLISGAVKNVPKENVEVMDDSLTLLSKNLYTNTKDNDKSTATTSTDEQQKLKQKYEKDEETNLLNMLEAVYGKDKVKVKVNADLDFDAVQQDSTTYDPKSVVVSEHNIKDNSPNSTNSTSSSPVDNNMTNSTATNNANGATTHDETTKNYDVSNVEQKTIKAPGSVKRLTASVALDGNVDDATKTSIKNLATSAIGYDDKRGDTISIEGIPFDTTSKDKAKKDLDAMNKATDQAAKNKMYAIFGIIAAVIIGAVTAIILWRRKRRDEEDLFDDELNSKGIDVIVGDEMDNTKQQPKFKPVELETQNEQTHVENEIKKYAKDKPEQVADIIKSWIAEDER